MAKKAKRVIGVEVVAPAIEDAHKNAERNGSSTQSFYVRMRLRLLPNSKRAANARDVIIIDPPRKGCAPELLHTVVQMNPERMVMFPVIRQPSHAICAFWPSWGMPRRSSRLWLCSHVPPM